MKLFIIFSLFFSLLIYSAPNEIDIKEVTKDGIYLNIGTKNGVGEFTELFDKSQKIKIKIIKIFEAKSIACLIDESGGCDYNIKHLLEIKDLKFYVKNVEDNKTIEKIEHIPENELFVRKDNVKFQEISQKDIDFFKNNKKVFDLVIFNHDENKRDAKYRLNGAVNLYTIGGIELLETDYSYFNTILQGDLQYQDDLQKFNFIFDTNAFIQKKSNSWALNIYQLSYALKYKRFSVSVGRDNLSDLGDFYLTDGLFINYKNNGLKFGILSSFGIDYYNRMQTDFNHIYIGGYGKFDFKFFNDYKYGVTLGFIPELFNNSLGILPVYLNNSFAYKDKISLDYQFKMSYSKLDTDKSMYYNHYLTLNLRPIDKLNIRLGFDSREYLDLINYSYYESILEKIDSDKSKNIYGNVSYKFNKDLLSFMYKHRINLSGADEYTLRYFNYNYSPFEYSFRTTSLFMKDVNIYIADVNVSDTFFKDWRFSLNLLGMLEQVKIINDTGINIIPQISAYKKFFSYFYLKGEFFGELRTKRISGMIKIGYIFDNEMK